jgi:hypothetical protein
MTNWPRNARLPERKIIPPEEDRSLEGVFCLPLEPEDHSYAVPPFASVPQHRQPNRILSIAGHYAALAGVSTERRKSLVEKLKTHRKTMGFIIVRDELGRPERWEYPYR